MADGVNIYLCVVAAILLLIIIAANIYVLVYFQNVEDKNTAIFPKVVTVFTFTIVCVSILMLPLDKANSTTKQIDQRGIPMDILWQVILITMAVLAFVVPFAFFYYEAEDPDEKSNAKQLKAAFKWDIVWAVFFFLPTFIMWVFIGYVEIPVVKYYSVLQDYDNMNDLPAAGLADMTIQDKQHVTYRISFVLYLISMITFVGSFFLVFFGGVGLAALPMDLINGFRKRGKRMNLQDYSERKLLIGKRSGDLLETAKKIQERIRRSGGTRPKGRKDIREYNRFRAAVFIVEMEFKKLEKNFNRGLGPTIISIAWEWLQLLLGIIGLGISVMWLVHIIVFMAPVRKPLSLFWNKMFIDMDNVFGLFGTIAFSVVSFYLLLCVIKGNFKVGVRIPLFCTIHPMRVGETLMNAFLFNALVILLATFSVIKFCADAFRAYATTTAIDVLYNIGVGNLRYIKYFFRYYYWVMIGIAILTTIFLFIYPSDKKATQSKEEEELPQY